MDVPITSRIEQGKHVNAKCPHCQSKDVKKLIDRPNVHFKGTGFTKGSVQ